MVEGPLVGFGEGQVERLDAPVGLEHLAQVAPLAPVGLLVDLAFVDPDDVIARELEPVGPLQTRQAFAARSLRYTSTPNGTAITTAMTSDMATTIACPMASSSTWSQLVDR